MTIDTNKQCTSMPTQAIAVRIAVSVKRNGFINTHVFTTHKHNLCLY